MSFNLLSVLIGIVTVQLLNFFMTTKPLKEQVNNLLRENDLLREQIKMLKGDTK